MSEKVRGLSDDDDLDNEVEDQDNTKSKAKQTDFMKVTGNLLMNINYKVAFLLFVVSMLIFSNVFIDGILRGFDGTVEADCPTTKGTIGQLIVMVLVYIILDLIVKYEIL